MTRSRRAGLSRDEARQQPLYARMLGLQYLAPGGFLCFVFLEGAVALGILLALAELVSWWGVLVLPAMVAAMVKLNDVVAGSLIHPAGAARTMPGATVRADPRGSLHADPCGSARAGSPGSPGSLGSAHAGSPGPTRAGSAGSPGSARAGAPGSARAGAPGSLGSARAGSPGSLGSGRVDPSGTGRIGSSGSARDGSLGPGRAGAPGASGAETVRLSAEAIAQVNAVPPAGGAAPALRPAALRHVTADAGPGARDEERWPPPPAMDASALNGPPVTRQWTEDLDDSRQRARQSAARRYE